ncbi:hypothetical protein DXG01_013257 [Tephrocybe rancida]|nr:hypothetical protein DXG01_013257 [Tephrocybe rancida]
MVKRIPDLERDKDGMEVMYVPDKNGDVAVMIEGEEKVEQRGDDGKEDKMDVKKEQKGKEEIKPKEEPDKGKAEYSIKFSVPTKPPSLTPSAKSVASTKSTTAPTPSSSAASSSTAATTKPGTKKASGSRAHAPTPRTPNLVLPTWDDTFHTLLRSRPPPSHNPNPHNAGEGSGGALSKTMRFVNGVLFSGDGRDSDLEKRVRELEEKGRERRFGVFGAALPRAWDVLRSAVPPAPPSASAQQCRWGKGKSKERARRQGLGSG